MPYARDCFFYYEKATLLKPYFKLMVLPSLKVANWQLNRLLLWTSINFQNWMALLDVALTISSLLVTELRAWMLDLEHCALGKCYEAFLNTWKGIPCCCLIYILKSRVNHSYNYIPCVSLYFNVWSFIWISWSL
jgi:hypothetical protein